MGTQTFSQQCRSRSCRPRAGPPYRREVQTMRAVPSTRQQQRGKKKNVSECVSARVALVATSRGYRSKRAGTINRHSGVYRTHAKIPRACALSAIISTQPRVEVVFFSRQNWAKTWDLFPQKVVKFLLRVCPCP